MRAQSGRPVPAFGTSRTTSAPRTRRPAKAQLHGWSSGWIQLTQHTPVGAQPQAAPRMKETKNKTVLVMRLEGNEGRSGLLQTIVNGPDSKIGPTIDRYAPCPCGSGKK